MFYEKHPVKVINRFLILNLGGCLENNKMLLKGISSRNNKRHTTNSIMVNFNPNSGTLTGTYINRPHYLLIPDDHIADELW